LDGLVDLNFNNFTFNDFGFLSDSNTYLIWNND
jgi:hypothetical protein